MNETTVELSPLSACGRKPIPHMHQYAGVWSMDHAAFRLALDFTPAELAAHVDGFEPETSPAFSVVAGKGVAVIDMIGAFTKYGSSFASNPGTLQLRRMIRTAAVDRGVSSIVLRIDSPGGAMFGIDDLAQEVRTVADRMPVVAFIEDLGASAAYYIASQATRIVANASALVGSIGSYAVIYDQSGAFAKRGIVAFVIKSGKFKGTGVPGTELTVEQRDEIQREVNQINEMFVAAVASGRGMGVDDVRALADGSVEIASEALRVGLIDSIGNLDVAIDLAASLKGRPAGAGNLEVRTMRENVNAQTEFAGITAQPGMESPPPSGVAPTAASSPPPAGPPLAQPVALPQPVPAAPAAALASPPATLAELKRSMPDSSAEFRETCIEANLPLDAARDRWMDVLRGQAAHSSAELEKAHAAAKRPGVPAVGSTVPSGTSAVASTSGNPVEEFEAVVAANRAKGMKPGPAMQRATIDHPELHAEYITAYNEQRGRPGR